MREPFVLEWFGGAAERHFRRLRPGVEDLPWGSLKPKDVPAVIVDRARATWTDTAVSDYVAAASFASLISTFLAARVPIDLVAMASDYVADEVHHVELASRVAMELGGAAPTEIDFAVLASAPPAGGADLLARANEAAVALACVAEPIAATMLSAAARNAHHPLVRGVLDVMAHDEGDHARLGALYLEWASDHLDDAERRRLASIAEGAIARELHGWRRLRARDGTAAEHVRELGWIDAGAFARAARIAVLDDVAESLARHGIVLAASALERTLATEAAP